MDFETITKSVHNQFIWVGQGDIDDADDRGVNRHVLILVNSVVSG